MTSFKQNVERYIRVHKELTGLSFSRDGVAKDLFNSFGYNVKFSLQEIDRQTTIEYGLFLGRCQPFTNGHNAIVQDIIRDGKTPIIILGSINIQNEKNPLTFKERKALIELVYSSKVVTVVGLDDEDSWDAWYNSVKAKMVELNVTKEQLTLYSHCKENDNKDFEYNGKEYKNESYTKMFEENGVKIKNLDEVVCELGETIHASDVRADEEIAKRNLDARIYIELKNTYGWWA